MPIESTSSKKQRKITTIVIMIPSSNKAKRTSNPIRNIVDNLCPPKNHPLKILNLAQGDPTLHGNLKYPSVINDNLSQIMESYSANGYLPSFGSAAARQAIAQRDSLFGTTVSDDDVIIASGCSGALDLALTVLLNEGDNVLVPNPSFPLYQVITESLGCRVKHYHLKPESSWECDLVSMDKLIDAKTKAIVINNPSNPCGSNFTAEHLVQIAAVARKHNLPIIADEIYGHCVFNGEFSPMHIHSGDVPVLSVGGLAKQFVMPGWRVGWIVIHDKGTGRLREIRAGLKSLTQIVLGANSLIQAVIPKIICPEKGSEDERSLAEFHEKYMNVLRSNAVVCRTAAETCPEITVIESVGAMYVMIGIDVDSLDMSIKDDTDFAKLLLAEQNLVVLPGQCFGMRNYIRLVTCPPPELLSEAFARIAAFINKHRSTVKKESNRVDTPVNHQLGC